MITVEDKLNRVVASTKAGLYITHNAHRSNYESVKDWLECLGLENDEVSEEIVDEMTKRDSLWCVQSYVNTPVGFYLTAHYELEGALDAMILALDEGDK